MPPTQTVTLTTRLVSLWFFFHAGTNLLSIPATAYDLFIVAYIGSISGHSRLDYYRFASLASSLMYFSCELLMGFFFYRAGPRAVRFLFGASVPQLEQTPGSETAS